MAKLRKYQFGSHSSRRKHNWSNKNARSEKKRMLDTRRAKAFHFDLDDELCKIANQDAVGFLRGNINAKANALGIDEAKEYLDRMVDDKVITEQECESIGTLLDRYSKWR